LTFSKWVRKGTSDVRQKGIISPFLLVRWIYGELASSFLFQRHFILKGDCEDRAIVVCPPKIDMNSVDLRVISCKEEFEGLLRKGYRLEAPFQRGVFMKRIEGGQIAFCVFIAGTLAHVSWVITRVKDGKKVRIHPPLLLDYNQAAYIWYSVTSPRFRGNNLFPYILSVINRQLQREGIKESMMAVLKDNKASLSGVKKAGFRTIGEDWYVKLWKWERYKVRFYNEEPANANNIPLH
jgi:ribosomal protein S18 acetylase RimI-like enzyme